MMKCYSFLFKCACLLSLIFHSPIEAAPPTSQAAFQSHSEWFATFLKNTDQKSILTKVILQNLQHHFPPIWQRIQDPDYRFNSAFVGIGTGGLEIPLMQEFAKSRRTQDNLKAFCEDPSPQMREEFFIAATSARVTDQVAEYTLLPFEDPTYTLPQVDFALASHVWYYIQSWREIDHSNNSLAKFARTLSDRLGVGLIALHSKTSDRYVLSSDYASRVGLEAELAGEEIASELCRLGINHKCEIVESHLNMESCFEGGHFNPNKEGKNLLSFILRAPWDSLPKDTQERTRLMILSQVEANGKEELILRDCHIWIFKE